MSSGDKAAGPGLTIDRAAFLLLRVKKAFKKKKQQRKEKCAPAGGECQKQEAAGGGGVAYQNIRGQSRGSVAVQGQTSSNGKPAPLLRSRTLPAIVAPGLNILQAQIDAGYAQTSGGAIAVIPPYGSTSTSSSANGANLGKRDSAVSSYGKLLTPRISFTDDAIVERRVSDTGPSSYYRDGQQQQQQHKGGRLSTCSIGSSQPLVKLARLLNQRPSFTPPSDDIPRRLSWERRDGSSSSGGGGGGGGGSSCLPRSSSIDSVAEWSLLGGSSIECPSGVYGAALGTGSTYGIYVEQSPPRRSPSPLLGSRGDRLSLVSPSIGRRVKGHRVILELHSLQGMEFLESFGKKKHQLQQQQQQQRSHQYQLINLSSIHINNPLTAQPSLNIHLHALFAAVEHGHIDKARAILESTDVNVNSVNSDGLSPLDVAVLSSNRPLAKMLVAFGAQEGNQCTSFIRPLAHCVKSPETLGSHLASLLSEAEHRVQELGGPGNSGPASLLEPPSSQSHRASFSSQHNNLTGCSGGGSAEDKQLALWERRARALRKMLLGFNQARPPDMPYLVTVDVTGITSVMARFQESETQDAPICTKFKIQWSFKEDFAMLCGERELLDMKQKECRIEGLLQGHRYYFRAAAGNLKGYSRFRPTTPTHLMPSSWRDIDGRMARFAGRLEQLDNLFTDVRGPEYSQETPAVQRRNHKKKTTIKQLFTATSKFQKNLRRGVFLACLLYHEDKVLVTNEDFLPVIEVDETYPSCIYNDFHWLMKVACTWDDVKSLRQDMEKSHSSSTNHFRIKLLQAAAQMQAALCIQDLGQLYHKPIRDVQGTLVFSSVNYVRSPKQVSVLNSRWLPLAKVTKKLITHEDSNVADFLMASIQDQMAYHQASSIKLSRGLYLGYLKMQSSVDSIQVLVPAKSPNVLPHCKVRDNPHVSAEEWEYLKRMGRLQASGELYRKDECDDSEEKENASNEQQGSEQQKLFIDVVAATAKRLFSYMEISAEESLGHRLYDAEVIELSPEVSFLVAVPPAEIACSVPGAREISLQRSDLLSLPIQVFEMVHLNTYQKDVINRYSRLSCILELDTAQAQHNHREAFSSSELSIAKDKLARLQDLQSQMNSVWKSARWLIDLITFARDRGTSSITSSGICVRYLLSLERNKGNSNSLKRSLLQLPPRDPKLVKSSPGRGSWPGPSVDRSGCSQTNLLSTELSKSEQQLPLGPYPRKGSNSSNCSSASEPYKSVSGCGSGGGSSNIHGPGSSGSLCPGTSNSATALGGSANSCRLPPSKSEDTLHLGSKQYKQSPRNRSSATTSPLLGGSSHATSESSHSISSADEYPTTIKTSNRLHISKPTASIASIASTEKQPLQQLQQSKLSPEDKEIENCTRASASTSVAPMPGILQVYAAYETGLASGTSLKLHVTGRTTAREVVDLVVKQLNMAVLLKGLEGPVYAQEDLANFCLVAVIGARERCLRDDFKPLQLQNPWKKGRLYVRQKQDVLAALEHSSKHTAFL
ncbi:uncharacterized protein LOC100123939 isoform X2 [Nasonia vitripennis]|uniref:Ankyrin repeat and fibronectin type-III domain-containing protein 1 n=1 Tax=Nasonia vitripennis TaxID=7425 RepID=A0A7M7T6I8_NASVI|nr:uncharacterized protein LOC100123939 isoform X2 [Nasonia vitripennis]XP_031777816.1 uncharacterized protein LOC100123939 isoform X2 [Nasonia vitripennis]XP_031777817.1 uncharacterized protein LOC100123939 isoform X2 [Nasonia vitripennis]